MRGRKKINLLFGQPNDTSIPGAGVDDDELLVEEGSPGEGDLRTGTGLPEQGGAIDRVEYLEE